MYNKLSSFQNLYYYIIIFRFMRKCTVCTYLKRLTVLFDITLISRTVFHFIQRTITEQTVEVIKSFVAREIFAICIFKIFI